MEPSSAQCTNGAVFFCSTRFFVHGNQRSDCPSSRDVSRPQQIFRVLMLSESGTVLCVPRAIFLADVSGVPVKTDGGESPRREPQE